VRDYKARHASTLLVFDAVETALAEVETRRAAEKRAAEGRTGQELEPAGVERCDTR
jgi:hypothetical protein